MLSWAFLTWTATLLGLAEGELDMNSSISIVATIQESRGRPDEEGRNGLATGAAPQGPQRTFMQCLGTQTLTRACHFDNLYYDIKEQEFVFFGVEGASSEVFSDSKHPDLEQPWLRLVRSASKAVCMNGPMLETVHASRC